MQTPDKETEKASGVVKDYTKYAGMAITMGAIIGIFSYAGYWLDGKWPISEKTPVYTLVLSLIGVALGLYSVLKEFIGKNKQ